jgi:hypothetical protein
MTDSDYASRQLRVIRALMERATVYRSISAPMALVGGLLSLGGFGVAWYADRSGHALRDNGFLALWVSILAVTAATNVIFLARGAARRGEPFFSAGMKCALRSLGPAFLLAAVLTVTFPVAIPLTMIWITLYGVALLATHPYAPRSLTLLGAAFLVTGIGLILGVQWLGRIVDSPSDALGSSALMAATFGGFHLIYAIAVWLRREDSTEAAPALTGNGHV